MQGRALEQIDYMYNENVPARKMSTYVIDDERFNARYAAERDEEEGGMVSEEKGMEKGEFEHRDL